MSEVLFVCRRNVIRSPLAAAIWNAETGTQEATSAGLRPKRLQPVLHPLKTHNLHHDMKDILAQDGISISRRDLRPHKLTEEQAQNAGRIILLTSTKNIPDFVREHPNVSYWPTEDPDTRSQLEYAYLALRQRIEEDLEMQTIQSA